MPRAVLSLLPLLQSSSPSSNGAGNASEACPFFKWPRPATFFLFFRSVLGTRGDFENLARRALEIEGKPKPRRADRKKCVWIEIGDGDRRHLEATDMTLLPYICNKMRMNANYSAIFLSSHLLLLLLIPIPTQQPN